MCEMLFLPLIIWALICSCFSTSLNCSESYVFEIFLLSAFFVVILFSLHPVDLNFLSTFHSCKKCINFPLNLVNVLLVSICLMSVIAEFANQNTVFLCYDQKRYLYDFWFFLKVVEVDLRPPV